MKDETKKGIQEGIRLTRSLLKLLKEASLGASVGDVKGVQSILDYADSDAEALGALSRNSWEEHT